MWTGWLVPQGHQWYSYSLKAGRWRANVAVSIQRQSGWRLRNADADEAQRLSAGELIPPCLERPVFFTQPFKTDWMRHFVEGNLLFLEFTNLNVNLIQKILSKLTHEINHHIVTILFWTVY